MNFNMDNLLSKTAQENNQIGAVPVNAEQQMYNAYGYLYPGVCPLPQQQFGQPDSYQVPWSSNACENEHNCFQVHYKLDGLREHSRVKSAGGYANYHASDSNSPGNIFGEHVYPVNNNYQRLFQSQAPNPGSSYIGIKNHFIH